MVWATDPDPRETAPSRPASTGTDEGATPPADAGAQAEDGDDTGRADATDTDEASLEPWQKHCPECGAVLVVQAVRCTGCGAHQPDGDGVGTDADGREQPAREHGAADTGSDGPESPQRRREAGESHYRERPRRDRRDESRDRRQRREPPREGRDRTTGAGGGEVQYERERRTEPERRAEPGGSEREPPREAAGGYRERRRRERPSRERSVPDRDRSERLAERQAARRADAETPYEPAVPSSRWWLGVLVPAALTVLGAAIGIAADPTAIAAGTVPWIGDGGGLLELGVVLTPTLAPFALYFDRRYVAHETGRTPSAAYYLLAVPYLNLVVTGLYLWWRQQWLAEA